MLAVATGDERTAEDAYQFLLGFLTRFPQFAGRPFWIGGESYGGHYVPNLALQVGHVMMGILEISKAFIELEKALLRKVPAIERPKGQNSTHRPGLPCTTAQRPSVFI